MKRVFTIVMLGLLGFVMSVGIATLLLMRFRSAALLRTHEKAPVVDTQSTSAAYQGFCPIPVTSIQLVRIVEESDEWLVLCAPGKPDRVLISSAEGVTVNSFENLLAPDEYRAHVTVEASGDLDDDNEPEFILAFSTGNKNCAFPGHYRVAKVVDENKAILSQPFGECFTHPVLRQIENTAEFFVGPEFSVARPTSGISVRIKNGAFVVDENNKPENNKPENNNPDNKK